MTDVATTLHLQSQNLGGNEFITAEHERFDGILNEHYPEFSCIFVPAEHRERGMDEFSYAIVGTEPGKPPYVLRWLTSEQIRDPKSILQWIWEGDSRRIGKVGVLEKIEHELKLEQAIRMRDEAEIRNEMMDLTVNVIRGGRDRKNYYRHDGVTYR